MTECCAALGNYLVKCAENLIKKGGLVNSAKHLRVVTPLLGYMGDIIHQLDYMLLADFHPLRVALYGASGAQSVAVIGLNNNIRNLFQPVKEVLEQKGVELLDLYETPNTHPVLYQLVEALSLLGMAARGFFYSHFVLAQNTIGSSSIGSIGR